MYHRYKPKTVNHKVSEINIIDFATLRKVKFHKHQIINHKGNKSICWSSSKLNIFSVKYTILIMDKQTTDFGNMYSCYMYQPSKFI